MQTAGNATKTVPQKAVSRYVFDAGRSTFIVQAFSTGLLSAFGHNPKIAVRDIQGEVQFVASDGAVEDAQVHVTIGGHSFEVIDDISEKDRQEIQRQMHDEVLEVERFPEIRYDSLRVSVNESGHRLLSTLDGRLTLHGETRPLSLFATVNITGDILRALGEFQVNQRDFGIASVTVAGGVIKLKDEVKCTFSIVARKQG